MSGLAGVLVGRRRSRGGAAAPPDVRLLAAPVREPRTKVERVVADTLSARGPLSMPALVSEAARALYDDELTHGGGLADLGFFGADLFVGDVTHAIESARGALWDSDSAAGCRR